MTPRLSAAIAFMEAAHRSIGQKRKDNIRPYEVHPLDVMRRVAAHTDDEDILVAALFHDIIEDVYPKRPEIYELTKAAAGPRAWGFVLELTDTYTKQAFPELNRKARKQKERERYASMSPQARLVKLADIASNLADDGDVLEENGKPEVGFNRMFIKEKALCLPYLAESGAEKGSPLYIANARLYVEAYEILKKQAIKFDVKLN